VWTLNIHAVRIWHVGLNKDGTLVGGQSCDEVAVSGSSAAEALIFDGDRVVVHHSRQSNDLLIGPSSESTHIVTDVNLSCRLNPAKDPIHESLPPCNK
jgi:hypothetical protein